MVSEHGIDAVIFDMGGVVLESPFDLFAEFERAHELESGTLSRLASYSALGDGPWQRLERGEIALDVFCREFDRHLAAAGVEAESAELMALIAERLGVRPAMRAAVRSLRGRFRVAALTNIWDSDDGLARTLDSLRPEFDVFVESWRLGLRKPEPAIYDEACRQIGIAPERAVFIDDIGANLKPARALGMRTVKFETVEQTFAELGAFVGPLGAL